MGTDYYINGIIHLFEGISDDGKRSGDGIYDGTKALRGPIPEGAQCTVVLEWVLLFAIC